MSTRPNGGFCWANCSVMNGQRAEPIKEKRSTIVYILDTTPQSGKEVILDVFQFHSSEYPPRYKTTTLIHNKHHQCTDKVSELLKSKTFKELKKNSKKWKIARITGDTERILKLIEKTYVISSKANETMIRILKFNEHAKDRVDFCETRNINNDYIKYMRSFIKDYDNCKKNRKSTRIVIEGNTSSYYTITLKDTKCYVIDSYILDHIIESIHSTKITAKILYENFKNIIPPLNVVAANQKRRI